MFDSLKCFVVEKRALLLAQILKSVFDPGHYF